MDSQEDEDSNSAFFSSIYSVTYSCRQLHVFVSTEYKNPLSTSHFFHQSLSEQALLLYQSPQQRLNYPKVFKKFRRSLQAMIIKFLTTGDIMFIRNNL